MRLQAEIDLAREEANQNEPVQRESSKTPWSFLPWKVASTDSA